MNREEIGVSSVHFILKRGRKRLRKGENLLLPGVDFSLANTCQFFRPNRGEKDKKIITAKERMREVVVVVGRWERNRGGGKGY